MDQIKKFFVYKITNKINGKIYIGQTDNLERRWKHHLKVSERPNDKNHQLIHKAILKYSKKNFTLEVIETSEVYPQILAAETHWIKFYKTNASQYGSEFGYNQTDGGEGWYGHKHTKESIEKMRQARLGKKASEATRKIWRKQRKGKGNGMFGRTHSKKSRNKIGKNRKDNKLSLGENNTKAKLTEKKVRRIKILLRRGELQKHIAKMYNVWPTTIQKIASGLNWKHIIV